MIQYIYPESTWNEATHQRDYHWPEFTAAWRGGSIVRPVSRSVGKGAYYASNSEYSAGYWECEELTDEQVSKLVLTKSNSNRRVRHIQGKVNARLGYSGPIKGGEARVLARMYKDTDLVRRGYLLKEWTTKDVYGRREHRSRNQHCYMFKSPHPEIPFTSFIKLVRLYRDDKSKLETAVAAVLANPEAANEIATCNAIETLAKLGVGNGA